MEQLQENKMLRILKSKMNMVIQIKMKTNIKLLALKVLLVLGITIMLLFMNLDVLMLLASFVEHFIGWRRN